MSRGKESLLRAAAEPVRGKYVPLARLATGGMAEILLARLEGAHGFEKLVVLKRLLPHLAEEQQHVAMFLDEARTVARISHPNVCQVHELGEEHGRYTIVMEYLEGVTLARVGQALPDVRGAFELRLVAELFRQACDGLHHAHELRAADGALVGLVHRDVSPQNLLVTLDGAAKILDFGIAKSSWSTTRTRAGVILGKTAYMSPEQVRGEPLDRRSDVFSLGVVLHELLTGLSLFRRDNDFLTYKAITEQPIEDVRARQPAVPLALAEIVHRALARAREDRPASARELGERIAAAVTPIGGPLPGSAVAEWMAARFGGELRERRARVADAMARQAQQRADDDDDAETQVEMLPTVPTDVEIVPPRLADAGGGVTRDSAVLDTLAGRAGVAGLGAANSGVVEQVRDEGGDPAAAAARRRRLVGMVAGMASVALAAVLILRCPVGPSASASDSAGMGASPSSDAAVALALVAQAVDAAPVGVPAPDAARAEPPADTARTEPPADTPRAQPPADTPRAEPRPARPARPPRERGPGWITIDSRPYATIYIDGKKIGVTPVLRHQLPAGAHQVRAVTPEGRQQRFRVVIEPGKEAARRRLVW